MCGGLRLSGRPMNNMLDQWLGDSIPVLENLEREVGENHYAIQRALAEIREREDVIDRLERSIAIIRRATADLTYDVEASYEEAQFEQEFDEAFFQPERLLEVLEEGAALKMQPLDEDECTETSNVVHVVPAVACGGGGGGRLPPPPPRARR